MNYSSLFFQSDLIAVIYKKYKDDLKSFLITYTHNVMDAEDILQNVFLKVMQLDIINDNTAKYLLFLIAKRMGIDYVRHRNFVRVQSRQLDQFFSLNDENSVARKVEINDILLLERHHLAEMSPKRAQIYELYRHEELTAMEIAKKLHLSKRTVETHIYLSSKDMRKFLRKSI
jgi:RNA polymerase sigma-70 factor (ECF subfamily)